MKKTRSDELAERTAKANRIRQKLAPVVGSPYRIHEATEKPDVLRDVQIEAMRDLLKRAADKLQDYCTEANGDLNDSLAAEIEKFLGESGK